MKHISVLLIAAIVLICTSAFAYDVTYLNAVKAHTTSTLTVDVPYGVSVVEVWATNNAVISCTFVDRGTGAVAYEAKNTQRCVGHANLALPTNMITKISNNGGKDLEYRIWVHDAK